MSLLARVLYFYALTLFLAGIGIIALFPKEDLPRLVQLQDPFDFPLPQEDFIGEIGTFLWTPRAPVENVIEVAIDSPGGRIDYMFSIANQIYDLQAKGIVVRCHIVGMAASAAFFLATQCSQRIAYDTTEMMWHEPGVYFESPTRLLLSDAKNLYGELQYIWDIATKAIHKGCGTKKSEKSAAPLKGFCPRNYRYFERLWRDETVFSATIMSFMDPDFFLPMESTGGSDER